MIYRIQTIVKGSPVATEIRCYDDAITAAAVAKERNNKNRSNGVVERYKLLPLDDTLTPAQQREIQLFKEGYYRDVEVPWHNECWYNSIRLLHFAILDKQKIGNVTYYGDHIERVNRTRRYSVPITTYILSVYDGVSEEEITHYYNECFMKLNVYKLRFAYTPEEIVRVYKHQNDLHSCMTSPYQRKNWHCAPIHPVESYGDSDLAIAYLTMVDSDIVLARTVVWPIERLYGRIFAKLNLGRILAHYLKTQGFDKQDTFIGARIRAIPCKGSYVCPYLDCAETVKVVVDKNGVEWLETVPYSSGAFTAKVTNGVLIEKHKCSNCNNFDIITMRTDTMAICSNCECEYAYCKVCRQLSRIDDMNDVYGSMYCTSCIKHFPTCSICNECTLNNANTTIDGEICTVCNNCADSLAICEVCDDYTNSNLHREHDNARLCTCCHNLLNEEETQWGDVENELIIPPSANEILAIRDEILEERTVHLVLAQTIPATTVVNPHASWTTFAEQT